MLGPALQAIREDIEHELAATDEPIGDELGGPSSGAPFELAPYVILAP